MLAGKQLACTPETCLNLIGYKQRAVAGTQFPDLGQIPLWRDDDAAFPLDGFDDEGCNISPGQLIL